MQPLLQAGRELDAQVAKWVMEWPRHEVGNSWPTLPFYGISDDSYVFVRWNDRDIAYLEKREPRGILERDSVTNWWRPSTDIAAAWQVVEKLPYFAVRRMTRRSTGETYWQVDYKICGDVRMHMIENDCCGSVDAPTVPEAICRAALKAVGA